MEKFISSFCYALNRVAALLKKDKTAKKNYNFLTKSDCEVIIALFDEKREKFIDELNGIFGFVIYDKVEKEFLVARDHIGIIPLYMGWDKNQVFYIGLWLVDSESV